MDNTKDAETRFPWGLAWLLGIAAGMWGLWWILTARVFDKWSDAGPFGDTFGGVNALFSAFAFAGIIYTILLQRKELRLQRLELEATREELSGQREQMVNQNATLLRQQFDSTFFQMLRLHHDIVDGMVRERPTGGPPQHGRQIFAEVRSMILNAAPVHLKKKPAEQALVDMWDEVYREFQAFLGHYFRNYYHLIKLVDEAPLKIDKHWYTSLARAQLSTDEHVSLVYNVLGRIGRRRFKSLVERYHLLENLHLDAIRTPAALALYTRSAYGDDAIKVESLLAAEGIVWHSDENVAASAPAA